MHAVWDQPSALWERSGWIEAPCLGVLQVAAVTHLRNGFQAVRIAVVKQQVICVDGGAQKFPYIGVPKNTVLTAGARKSKELPLW